MNRESSRSSSPASLPATSSSLRHLSRSWSLACADEERKRRRTFKRDWPRPRTSSSTPRPPAFTTRSSSTTTSRRRTRSLRTLFTGPSNHDIATVDRPRHRAAFWSSIWAFRRWQIAHHYTASCWIGVHALKHCTCTTSRSHDIDSFPVHSSEVMKPTLAILECKARGLIKQ